MYSMTRSLEEMFSRVCDREDPSAQSRPGKLKSMSVQLAKDTPTQTSGRGGRGRGGREPRRGQVQDCQVSNSENQVSNSSDSSFEFGKQSFELRSSFQLRPPKFPTRCFLGPRLSG